MPMVLIYWAQGPKIEAETYYVWLMLHQNAEQEFRVESRNIYDKNDMLGYLGEHGTNSGN
jgi:hypothetical protein